MFSCGGPLHACTAPLTTSAARRKHIWVCEYDKLTIKSKWGDDGLVRTAQGDRTVRRAAVRPRAGQIAGGDRRPATAWRSALFHSDLPLLRQRGIERLRQGKFPGLLDYRRRMRAQLRSLPSQDPRTDDFRHEPGRARAQGARSDFAQRPARLPAFRRIQPAQRSPYERTIRPSESSSANFLICALPRIRPCWTSAEPSRWRPPASMWR